MPRPDKLEIAEILEASGVINPEQKERAAKMAQRSKCSFGEAVVKLGFAKEESVAMALSKQLGVPYASKENRLLKVAKGQSLEKMVGENFAREHLIAPLSMEGNVLSVAMTDPTDIVVRENLKLLTRREIQVFVATKVQILRTIDEFYENGGGALIEKTLDKAEEQDAAREGSAPAGVDDSDPLVTRLDLDSSSALSGDAQVISIVNAVLKQAVAERCSDIHFESFGERVVLRFRIDGVLYERPSPPKKDFMAVISRIKILSKLDISERRLPQDGTFSVMLQSRPIDLRISLCPTVYGEKLVMRILDKGATKLDVEALGFEPKQKHDFLEAAGLPHGLIFLTGPTGSGKTTTLYAVLNTIKTPELNFMTIEDPVEIKLDGISQVQVRSSIGLTFASALRSFLRQDPDVILVGEVRDAETAQTCLRAALTGHLVLSTLHTNDALSAVVRLIDLGIEPFLLAGSLALVAAQRLVRVLCPDCKKPYKPSPQEWESVVKGAKLERAPDAANAVFYKSSGCPKCYHAGYKGRNAIYEIYRISSEMRKIISKEGGNLEMLRKAAEEAKMWDMKAGGYRKVLAGLTTLEEVLSVTVAE